ncbi:MAG: hypothetical protein NTY09_06235 [bacterium]|nr:hypothetical protein [bacterium]
MEYDLVSYIIDSIVTKKPTKPPSTKGSKRETAPEEIPDVEMATRTS